MNRFIRLDRLTNAWGWSLVERGLSVAYGTSPDYHQACECARIAWEQYRWGDA